MDSRLLWALAVKCVVLPAIVCSMKHGSPKAHAQSMLNILQALAHRHLAALAPPGRQLQVALAAPAVLARRQATMQRCGCSTAWAHTQPDHHLTTCNTPPVVS